MGGVGLAHEVVMLIRREWFVGGEDEVTVVKRGGGFLNPEIAVGDLAVTPTGDGGAVGIAIEDVAEEKKAGGRFAIALAFLDAGLVGVEAATPSEPPAAEMNGDGGVGGGPSRGGGDPAVQQEGGLDGVPCLRNRHEEGAGLIRNGRSEEGTA